MANLSSTDFRKLFRGLVTLRRPPKLEGYENRKRFYWRINLGLKADGQPLRKQIGGTDEGLARKIYVEICDRIEAGEFQLAQDCFETYADLEFQAVKKKLSNHAVTVTQAVDFYLKHHRPNKGIITVNDALKIWEENAERLGHTKTTVTKMKNSYAGPFAKAHGGLLLMDLNIEIAERYIYETKKNLSPYSKGQMIQKLKAFLNTMAKLGYYSKELNPFEKLPLPKAKYGKDKEKDRLISPEMMGEILEFALSSNRDDFLEMGAALLLQSFCGVRKTEITRMRREDIIGLESIDEEEDSDIPPIYRKENPLRISIKKLEAKWGHKRTFQAPENVVTWLRYFTANGWSKKGPFFTKRGSEEPLSDEGLDTRFGRFLNAFKADCETKKLEFPTYEQNGFRVSCASYGGKFFGVRTICEMMGERREATFWRHYREDCDESAARKYFGLIPRAETALREQAEEDEFRMQQAYQNERWGLDELEGDS